MCYICYGPDADDYWDCKKETDVAKAKVILFKASGKYYCEEEWEIPTEEELWIKQGHIDLPFRDYHFLPTCMRWSKDFRRIGGNGPVLVETQEPWGWPHLFPGTEEK